MYLTVVVTKKDDSLSCRRDNISSGTDISQYKELPSTINEFINSTKR